LAKCKHFSSTFFDNFGFPCIVSCNPVPQAGRWSAGRVHPLEIKFHYSVQAPVDYSRCIRHTAYAVLDFSLQFNSTAKRRIGQTPFGASRCFFSQAHFATGPFPIAVQ
ncbi:MAG: hypothetical protein LUH51_03410, partial [Firmicutes bacterium]|nr:hypothetical protein [Bacillota bacterium]